MNTARRRGVAGPAVAAAAVPHRHPGVVITRHDSFGYWQAWIPVTDGGTLITRYALADLLDALEELDGCHFSAAELFGG